MVKSVIRMTQAIIVLCIQFITAQNFTGQAVYESKSKPPSAQIGQRQISPEMQKMIDEQLKRQLEKTFVLNFNASESSWEEEQKLETPQPETGVNIRLINSGDSKRYNNLKTKTTLSEEEIFGKEFLVSDNLQDWNWTMTDETKKIGNYTCYKATALLKVTDEQRAAYEKRKADTEKNPNRIMIIDEPQDYAVTAWYTPDIPVGHGPEGFWGLPGLILETTDGQRTILCSKIILNPKEKPAIYVPETGDKVTRKEFDETREKKIKEMQSMPQRRGQNDGRTIRIGG